MESEIDNLHRRETEMMQAFLLLGFGFGLFFFSNEDPILTHSIRMPRNTKIGAAALLFTC